MNKSLHKFLKEFLVAQTKKKYARYSEEIAEKILGYIPREPKMESLKKKIMKELVKEHLSEGRLQRHETYEVNPGVILSESVEKI